MTQTQAIETWQDKRKRRTLKLSPTQIEMKRLCNRKWWLSRVRRLESPVRNFQVFGTVIHAICERYLLADDLGRDPLTGQPVELFPADIQVYIGDHDTEKETCHVCGGGHHPGDGKCKRCDGTGQAPKRLYKTGWWVAPARRDEPSEGEISYEEQVLARKLIAKALEEGVLERAAGRQVEVKFDREIFSCHCPKCKGAGHEWVDDVSTGILCEACEGTGFSEEVSITGYMDLMYPDAVHDHKTTKTMRYAKSANKLKENVQMMIYAYELLMQLQDAGKPWPEHVTLRHNVYCKDPEDLRVRKTDPQVTTKEVLDFWQTILVDAREMVQMRRTCNTWKDIPDPPTTQPCMAYGGCEFRNICNGKETEGEYELRLERYAQLSHNGKPLAVITNMIQSGGTSPPQNTLDALKGSTMVDFGAAALAAKNKMKNAALGGAPAAAALAAATQQAAAPAPVQQAAPVPVAAAAAVTAAIASTVGTSGSPPPWANPNCKACKGWGINSKGEKPCMICDAWAKQTPGKKPSSEFEVFIDTTAGTCTWAAKDGSLEGESPLPISPAAQNATVKAEHKTDTAPKQEPVPQVEAPKPAPTTQEQVPTPQQQAAAAQAANEVAETKKTGRPKRTFCLMVNCHLVKGEERRGSGYGVIRLEEELQRHGAAIAEALKVGSFYDLDAFARRDILMKMGAQIAEEFKTDYVVVSGIGTGQSDLRALVDAIRPFATTIIESSLL